MPAYARARVLLRFDRDARDPDRLRQHLSACVRDRDGNLWLGTDELTGLSRLKPEAPGVFAKHDYTDLSDRLQLPEEKEEIDVEGLDIEEDRLWIVGSHTSTRKGIKPDKNPEENLRRLAQVEARPNRYLIACATVADGKLKRKDMAQLPISEEGNALTLALREDLHLGPYLCTKDDARLGCVQIGSKENGFDVEGVAVRGDRLLLGLRGPVLRGWAILLEIRLDRTGDGALALGPIGRNGRPYRKHFLQLGGMGIRDLCWHGEDLLILTGPTMDIAGPQGIYRVKDAADLADDGITALDGTRLTLQLHLPLVTEGDKAEGLSLYDGLGEPGLLVVYDAPRTDRLVGDHSVLADVFALPGR